VHLVIVGGVAAGTKAAARARRIDPTMAITLFQEETCVSHSGRSSPTCSCDLFGNFTKSGDRCSPRSLGRQDTPSSYPDRGGLGAGEISPANIRAWWTTAIKSPAALTGLV